MFVYFIIKGRMKIMPQVSDKYLEERKVKIAKAAVNVFAEKGYSNATMQDIMEMSNISRGGLYAHFENIDAVFLAALRYDDSLPHNRFLRPDPKRPLLPQLKKWLQEMALSIEEDKLSLVRAKSEFFLSHSALDTPYLCERHEVLSSDIQSFIDTGIGLGEFSEQIDKVALSQFLISAIDGIMLHHHYQYSKSIYCVKLFDFLEDILTTFLRKGGQADA